MELLQLQYFAEIVKNATMLKAAEALHGFPIDAERVDKEIGSRTGVHAVL